MKKMLVSLSVTLLAIGAFAQPATQPSGSDDQGVVSTSPISVASGGGSSGGSIVVPASKMPTTLAFLTSPAALRAFAVESARQAYLNLESAGMQGSWGTGSGWESPQTSRAILETINGWRFAFNMQNPKDYVHATAEIKNADWDTLFSAETWQTPEAFDSPVTDPAYRLPQLYFYFRMAELIPFKVDRAIQWAQIKYLNDDGKTITTVDLDVRKGKVYFRSDMAGKGILVLQDNNGNTFLYNLRNGGVRVPMSRIEYTGSQSWIDGVVTYKNQQVINHKIWSYNGVGQNPTLEVSLSATVSVHVRVYSNEGAQAIGFQVRMQDSTNWNYYPAASTGEASIPIGEPDRVHYIVPVWNPDEFKDPEPYIPEKGYGPVPVYPGKG